MSNLGVNYMSPNYPVYNLGAYNMSPWNLTAGSFPDTTARWIWNTSGAHTSAPVNVSVQLQYIFFSNTWYTGKIYTTADNSSTVYLNGQVVIQTSNFNNSYTVDVSIVYGYNYFIIDASNGGTTENPAGVIFTLYNPITSTYPVNSNGNWVWSSGQTIQPFIINYPCFKEGSFITCLKDGQEQDILIEKLASSQPVLVKTLCDGFLPIRAIGKSVIQNPYHSDRIKGRLYRLTHQNYPEIYTPLYLTGCHGILFDSLSEEERKKCKEIFEGKIFTTSGKYRLFTCLDERAEPWIKEGSYNIYHLALESDDPLLNYGIYANGLLVESCHIWSLLGRDSTMEIIYKI